MSCWRGQRRDGSEPRSLSAAMRWRGWRLSRLSRGDVRSRQRPGWRSAAMKPTQRQLLATSSLRDPTVLNERALYQLPGWSWLRDSERRASALRVLADAGWIRRPTALEAEGRVATGRYRRACGRRHREPLATETRRDQDRDARAQLFKMFKMFNPPDILCKLNKLNSARAWLRHASPALDSGTPDEWRERLAKFFRNRASTTCPANAGRADAGVSSTSHKHGPPKP